MSQSTGHQSVLKKICNTVWSQVEVYVLMVPDHCDQMYSKAPYEAD